MSPDANYVANSNFTNTYIYQANSQEPGAQVVKIQNYGISLGGIFHSDYLIGIKNTEEVVSIYKIKFTDKELQNMETY